MMAQETTEKNKRITSTALATKPDLEMIVSTESSHPEAAACSKKDVKRNRNKLPPNPRAPRSPYF